jgi:KamA family protein
LRRTFRVYTRKDIDRIPALRQLTQAERLSMKAVSAVLPFRVNNYVVEELIDWSDIPHDPIFQLTFPQPKMLAQRDFERILELVRAEAPADTIKAAARKIQNRMNPHPAGQLNLNVPRLGGEPLPGVQHKYRETVLFFPTPGQTCHAYCTYCFRWAQFVGINELKFAASQTESMVDYLRVHPEVTSVLITGGDPMVMRSTVLRRFIEPLLHPSLEHVESIRIGTKSLAYWPYRFVTDSDADDVLRLFNEVQESGKHLALMAHYSHPRELETQSAVEAVERIKDTGAVIRCQAPLIRHVNNSADCWAELWRRQVRAGAVPYYMFLERNTGPKNYFTVPLARALEIFRGAYTQVSGLCRTVRGPSMSANPGKVLINGVTTINGEKVFALQFLQGRDPEWVGRPFFAKFDPRAVWLDDLRPAFGEREFFFEPRMREIQRENQPTPSA